MSKIKPDDDEIMRAAMGDLGDAGDVPAPPSKPAKKRKKSTKAPKKPKPHVFKPVVAIVVVVGVAGIAAAVIAGNGAHSVNNSYVGNESGIVSEQPVQTTQPQTMPEEEEPEEQEEPESNDFTEKLCSDTWVLIRFYTEQNDEEEDTFYFNSDGTVEVSSEDDGSDENTYNYEIVDDETVEITGLPDGDITVYDTPCDEIVACYDEDDYPAVLTAESFDFNENYAYEFAGSSYHSDYLEEKYSIENYIIRTGKSSVFCTAVPNYDSEYLSPNLSIYGINESSVLVVMNPIYSENSDERDDKILCQKYYFILEKTGDESANAYIYDNGTNTDEEWTKD